MMANGRMLFCVVIITIYCLTINAKVFTRCHLTRELLNINFSRTYMSNWVCMIEKQSARNTSAFVEKTSRRKYYGLFYIGSEWCREGKRGGKCDIPCEWLLDDDIWDDAECALKVQIEEGFKYWPKWESRCKGHTLPDIEKCPDFQQPPGSRASPPRSRRRRCRPLLHHPMPWMAWLANILD